MPVSQAEVNKCSISRLQVGMDPTSGVVHYVFEPPRLFLVHFGGDIAQSPQSPGTGYLAN